MICVSIQNKTFDEICALLDAGGIEMAEIRLDRCPLSDGEIGELFASTDIPLIATCRIAEASLAKAEMLLLKAIDAGAAYADLEIEAPPQTGKRIRHACNEAGAVLIRSWHDFEGTPSMEVLEEVAARCRRFGGEIVKLVTTARSGEDIERVLSFAGVDTVAFCMGEAGRESRLECLRKGSPFSYAALTAEEATAPGQWTLEEMAKKIYGGTSLPLRPEAPVAMPSSKSFAQRAIIAAALAEGTSRLSGYTPCGDNESAIAVARAIGATVRREDRDLVVDGIAAEPGSISLGTLHTGESGFLTRMMIPILSVIDSSEVFVTGEKTLLNRPLAGAHDIMASFGVRLRPGNATAMNRKTDCCVPLTVCGPLVPGKADLDGKDGSQLISGLLSALPLCQDRSTVYVHQPRSIPYMFITVDVLQHFGIRIGSEMEGGEEFMETRDWGLCDAVSFKIKGGQRYKAADFRIEGDWSSAANFLVAGAVFGEVWVEDLDTASLQADLSILDILRDAGASISQLGEGDTAGALHVQKAPLRAFETDLNNCPDLFPIVAVLAAFCEGTSRILGAGRLAHKETDRAAAIVGMLTRMGVRARVEEDLMTIEGLSLSRRLLTGRLLHGGEYTSSRDHRMVMALKVASLGADSPVVIDDTACVEKSYPGFMEDWKLLDKR